MGQVIQAGAKINPARQAAVRGGLPVTVPALTVNRVCGSGAQAIVSAAQDIYGSADAAVAGGMENMDQAPYLIPRGRWGYRLGNGQLTTPCCTTGSTTRFPGRPRAGTRKTLPETSKSAARSKMHGRCARSSASAPRRPRASSRARSSRSRCRDERPTVFEVDEHNRPDTTLETLAKLRPRSARGNHYRGQRAWFERRRQRHGACR